MHGLFALAKPSDRLADALQHRVVKGFRQTDVQLAQQNTRHALCFAFEAFDGSKQLARGLEYFVALGRQAKATFAALTEDKTEAGFQLGHLCTDGRLGHAQHALRGAEAAALDHADENAQQL